jgi:hypothetical protein
MDENTDRIKRLDRFYSEEFPIFVKEYYNEFSVKYPTRYEPLSTIGEGNIKKTLFRFIEDYFCMNYNIPYDIRKEFDFHTTTLFYAQTNEFGFSSIPITEKEIPNELFNEFISIEKENILKEYSIFSRSFSGISGISKIIKEKINVDIEIECELIKMRLKSYLKRFFIQGGVSWKWIVADQIYYHGIDKFPNCLDDEFKQLEYSIEFFEKCGHLGTMDDEESNPGITAEYYKKELTFYNELKKKKIQDYTYLDVLKERIIIPYQEKNEFIIKATCNELGLIPLIELKNLLPEIERKYEENYFNFLVHKKKNNNVNPYEFPINFKLDITDVLMDEGLIHDYLETFNEPENEIRKMFGLPKIGEGWISETNLYYEIKTHFSNEVVMQHGRPKWLGKQHLDIYIPKHNIAIEYQGDQHYYPIDFFGGEESFIKNKARDETKRQLCKQNNCELIYVNPGYDLNKIITEIKNIITK